jgi:hypothetical protein
MGQEANLNHSITPSLIIVSDRYFGYDFVACKILLQFSFKIPISNNNPNASPVEGKCYVSALQKKQTPAR